MARVNIWNFSYERHSAFTCITTNGSLNSAGSLVMGRGIAKQASLKFPGLSRELAALVRVQGNKVHILSERKGYKLVAFPVKYLWDMRADLDLIKTSAKQLEHYARLHKSCIFLLPRPGCGNGGLDWQDVEPIISFLPDNVFVLNNEGVR